MKSNRNKMIMLLIQAFLIILVSIIGFHLGTIFGEWLL